MDQQLSSPRWPTVGRRGAWKSERNWEGKATTTECCRTYKCRPHQKCSNKPATNIASNAGNSFSFTCLLKLQEQVQGGNPGNIPLNIIFNHRKARNPYLSHYGANWEEHISQSGKLKTHICITELIKHIVRIAERVFLGTRYKENATSTMMLYHKWQTMI